MTNIDWEMPGAFKNAITRHATGQRAERRFGISFSLRRDFATDFSATGAMSRCARHRQTWLKAIAAEVALLFAPVFSLSPLSWDDRSLETRACW